LGFFGFVLLFIVEFMQINKEIIIMARKTLLTESELRRFMKLAEMHPISDERIEEMATDPDLEEAAYSMPGDRDEELDEPLPGEEGADVMDLGDLEPEEVGVEPEGVPVEEVDPELVDKFSEFMKEVSVLAKEVLGVDMEVEGEPTGEVEPVEEPVVDEPTLEPAGPEGGEPEELGVGLEEGEEELAEADEDLTEADEDLAEANEDDIVAEVARRVAARLQREASQAEVVDQLAERIMKRLTK